MREDSFWNRGEIQIAFVLYYHVKWLAYEKSHYFVLQSEMRSETEYGKLRSVPGTRGFLHVDSNQMR